MSPPGAAGPHLRRCGAPTLPDRPRGRLAPGGGVPADPGLPEPVPAPAPAHPRGARDSGATEQPPTSVQLAAGGTVAGTGEPAAPESSANSRPSTSRWVQKTAPSVASSSSSAWSRLEGCPVGQLRADLDVDVRGCGPGGRRSVGSAATGWTARAVRAGRPAGPPGSPPARARRALSPRHSSTPSHSSRGCASARRSSTRGSGAGSRPEGRRDRGSRSLWGPSSTCALIGSSSGRRPTDADAAAILRPQDGPDLPPKG